MKHFNLSMEIMLSDYLSPHMMTLLCLDITRMSTDTLSFSVETGTQIRYFGYVNVESVSIASNMHGSVFRRGING